MKIGVLGTGSVGQTIGSKLIQLGHEVVMGSRNADNEKAAEWVKNNGPLAKQGTFEEAAKWGEILFNCTMGGASLEVMHLAGADNIGEKILIDISNPLDFSKGFPPSLYPDLSNTASVGEEIQRHYPRAKVVKTLNTVNAMLMVDAVSLADGDHTMFMSGNDNAAKEKVKEILTNWFGWKDVFDLGDISNARGQEMILPVWVRLYGALQHPNFNFKLVR